MGTNVTALRGIGRPDIAECADLVADVVTDLSAGDGHTLTPEVQKIVAEQVTTLTKRFPIPYYPA